jgi:hypothetical protein
MKIPVAGSGVANAGDAARRRPQAHCKVFVILIAKPQRITPDQPFIPIGDESEIPCDVIIRIQIIRHLWTKRPES